MMTLDRLGVLAGSLGLELDLLAVEELGDLFSDEPRFAVCHQKLHGGIRADPMGHHSVNDAVGLPVSQ